MATSPLPRARVTRLAALLLVALLGGAGLAPGSAADAAAARVDPEGRWPLAPVPRVVRGFEEPPAPWAPGHRGVDLVGRPGQPVLAAMPGRVSASTVIAGVGVVVVDHGTTRTTYQPVGRRVAVGTEVAAGDVLGLLEPAGSHCAPASCLHWGWRRGATYLDPLQLVRSTRVRLLPPGQGGDHDSGALPLAPPPGAALGRLTLGDEPGGRRVAAVRW